MDPTAPPSAALAMAADVLIIGAGPAGLSLACALADAGMTVRLLEQQPRAALDDPPEDGREIALTHRARHVMQTLGPLCRVDARCPAPAQAQTQRPSTTYQSRP